MPTQSPFVKRALQGISRAHAATGTPRRVHRPVSWGMFLQGETIKDMFRRLLDSGLGYGSLTELPEVSGTGMKVLQNFQKFWVLWHGRA